MKEWELPIKKINVYGQTVDLCLNTDSLMFFAVMPDGETLTGRSGESLATRVRERLRETAAQALVWQKVIEVEVRVDEYQVYPGEPDDRVRIQTSFCADRYEWARAGDKILIRAFGAEDIGYNYLSLGGLDVSKFRPPMIGHIDGKMRQWFPYDDELWTALKKMGADWKQVVDGMDYRVGNLLTLALERAREAQDGERSGQDSAAGGG